MLPEVMKRRIREWVSGELAKGNRAMINERMTNVVENFYQDGPSGDYGRGDVREEIERALGKED